MNIWVDCEFSKVVCQSSSGFKSSGDNFNYPFSDVPGFAKFVRLAVAVLRPEFWT